MKSEASFELKFNYKVEADVNNETILGIKAELIHGVTERLDFFLAINRVFGFLIGFSAMYILYSKYQLVKQYNNDNPACTEPVSTVFIASNPFMLQVLIQGFFLSLDIVIRSLYNIHQNSTTMGNLELGTSISANVTSSGGTIGKYIADSFMCAIHMYDSIDLSADISSCFVNEMHAPSIFSYLFLTTVSLLGIFTYKIDKFSREYYQELIRLIYMCRQPLFL